MSAHVLAHDAEHRVAECSCSWRGIPIRRERRALCPVEAAEETDRGFLQLDRFLSMLEPTRPRQPRRVERQVGRNDPCWCESGRKYKRCHGA